jgi:hypothetical protein
MWPHPQRQQDWNRRCLSPLPDGKEKNNSLAWQPIPMLHFQQVNNNTPATLVLVGTASARPRSFVAQCEHGTADGLKQMNEINWEERLDIASLVEAGATNRAPTRLRA